MGSTRASNFTPDLTENVGSEDKEVADYADYRMGHDDENEPKSEDVLIPKGKSMFDARNSMEENEAFNRTLTGMERENSVIKEHNSGVVVIDTSSEKLSYDDNAMGTF